MSIDTNTLISAATSAIVAASAILIYNYFTNRKAEYSDKINYRFRKKIKECFEQVGIKTEMKDDVMYAKYKNVQFQVDVLETPYHGHARLYISHKSQNKELLQPVSNIGEAMIANTLSYNFPELNIFMSDDKTICRYHVDITNPEHAVYEIKCIHARITEVYDIQQQIAAKAAIDFPDQRKNKREQKIGFIQHAG